MSELPQKLYRVNYHITPASYGICERLHVLTLPDSPFTPRGALWYVEFTIQATNQYEANIKARLLYKQLNIKGFKTSCQEIVEKSPGESLTNTSGMS